MAGRAGRRGIDPEGQCVIALDARDGLPDLLKVVDGSPEPIESRFKLGYGSVAALIGTGAAAGRDPPADRVVVRPVPEPQAHPRDGGRDPRARDRRCEAARGYAAPCGDFARIGRYRRARQEVDARRQATGRGGRRGERSPVEAEPGRLALVRRKGAPSLAVILRVHAIRGHRVLLDALLPHGAVVRLKSGLIKRIFWATPPLNVPRDLQRGGRPDHRGAQGADRPARPPAAARADGARALARAGGHAGGDRVSSLPVGRDAATATTPGARSSGSNERLTQRRQALEAFRGAYWQEFLRVAEVLEQFGARARAPARAQGPARSPACATRTSCWWPRRCGGGSSRTPRWPRRPRSARRCSRSRAPGSR